MDYMQLIDNAIDDYVNENGKEVIINNTPELTQGQIIKLLKGENPQFIIDDIIADNSSQIYSNIFDSLDMDSRMKDTYMIDTLTAIADSIDIKVDYNSLFNIDVPVDILVDDSKSLDSIKEYGQNGQLIKVGKPIQWLLDIQGYSVREFLNFYNGTYSEDSDTYGEDRLFLASLANALDDLVDGSNIVVFSGYINLSKYLEDFTDLLIQPDITCSIIDNTVGIGATNIFLERPITLSINDVYIESRTGYPNNVEDVLGLPLSAWDSYVELRG